MARKQNTMFPGDAFLEVSAALYGSLTTTTYARLLLFTSSFLEIASTGVGILFKAGLRTPATSGSGATLTVNDFLYEVTSNGSGILLPAGTSGMLYTIKNDSGTTGTTITPNGAETIDGAGSLSLPNANDSCILQFRGTNWSIISTVARPTQTPSWVKVNLGFASFQTAALINSINLYSLAAGGVIHAVKLKQSTAFAGTSITAVTMSVGISGDLNREILPFDVLQAAGDTVFALSGITDSFDNANATQLVVTARSTGANLSALSAGVLDTWLLVSAAT